MKKKGLIIQTWERCKSIGRGSKSKSSGTVRALTLKSKSWSSNKGTLELEEEKRARKRRVTPEGCFSVYVGPQKQKFVIKTEYANHPLFKMLLEEAESEYGYDNQGPLVLPCNVDIFCKVLLEMEDCHEIHQGCSFKRYGSYHLLSPSRMAVINQFWMLICPLSFFPFFLFFFFPLNSCVISLLGGFYFLFFVFFNGYVGMNEFDVIICRISLEHDNKQ